MESCIQISKINDFLYCPMSIYLHALYEGFNRKAFHQSPQVVSTLRHQSIDQGTYSTSTNFLIGLEVASRRYNLVGKIDVYDKQRQALIERKTRVKKIYDGYRYQLYAQYFCMTEMGHPVRELFIHSLEDNKRYSVALPDETTKREFENVISAINSFNPARLRQHVCDRCRQSIYGALSW